MYLGCLHRTVSWVCYVAKAQILGLGLVVSPLVSPASRPKPSVGRALAAGLEVIIAETS